MIKIGVIVLVYCIVGCSENTSNIVDNNTITPTISDNKDGSINTQIPSSNDNPSVVENNNPNAMTDIGCGGLLSPKCSENKKCVVDSDCEVSCSYSGKCVSAPSCKYHFGADTCGSGEVGDANSNHEDCCKSLPVVGFSDPSHPGKTIYLDKYEITAGRIREFVSAITKQMDNKPNIRKWITSNNNGVWDGSWNVFLPTDVSGDVILINRMSLGDPRHLGETNPGPGVIIPPTTDQFVDVGLNYQFGGKVFLDTHGNNCGTYAGSYGFPTYYYPSNVSLTNGEVPRSDAIGYSGESISAQEWLDSKSINCISNAMLEAFCLWDTDGQGSLMTSEVFDFVTDSPTDRPQYVAGCGSQSDDHGNLLGNSFSGTIQLGGKCPSVSDINYTFDAGDVLPAPGSSLNVHRYHYPDLNNSTSDKAWEISSPGRMLLDVVSFTAGNEGWMDLGGNLTETTLETQSGSFTGKFALRSRGIGSGSSRSDLNVTLMPGETVIRAARAEAKSALVGGRCIRYKNK